MKCFNCNNKSTSFYSPKEIYKYQIYFCRKCLDLIKFKDLRYLENTNKEYANIEVKRLIKRKWIRRLNRYVKDKYIGQTTIPLALAIGTIPAVTNGKIYEVILDNKESDCYIIIDDGMKKVIRKELLNILNGVKNE